MKILLYSDCHFSTYSSIIRKRSERFSARLENLIKSINWAEDLSYNQECDAVVCLGDFFDNSIISAEECTALRDVEWCNIPHYFLVGNHEISSANTTTSSAHILSLLDRIKVIDHAKSEVFDDCEICFLPYTQNYVSIAEIFGEQKHKRIVLSHNDISGINYGAFVSNIGFDVDDITSNCDLFINGHLHNGSKINRCIYNIGNLTGQNFGEDAARYKHSAFILDTEDLSLIEYENPYAFNFYKLVINDEDFSVFKNLKNNAVVTIKCNESNYETLRAFVSASNNISDCRLIVDRRQDEVEEKHELEAVDHLKQFIKFVFENYGQSEAVVSELSKVCEK